MQGPSEDRLQFLRTLYGNAPTGFWFVVSTFPDGQSKAFPAAEPSIIEAVRYISHRDDGATHIFTSMALFSSPPSRGRGTAADARLLCALWCDVDVKDGASDDLATARKIIDSIPLQPSLLTCSGGGLHGFYIFSEPLSLESDGSRADAVDLLNRWKHTVMAHAAEVGSKVDKGTFDIARVMRISGTKNPKSQPPLPAYIIESNDVRYAESDFDPILRDAPDTVSTATSSPSITVTLSDDAVKPLVDLPAAFIDAMESDTRLRNTWKRQRTDLNDQSASGYSYALANACVALGFSNDQIAQIVCTWRQSIGAAEKATAWYEKMVAKVRSNGRFSAETASFIADVDAGAVTDRQAILDGMTEMLGVGVRIRDVVRYGGPKKATYKVVFDGCDEKEIGDADDFVDQRRWTLPMLDAVNKFIDPPMKKPAWSAFIKAALQVIRDVDVDEMSERTLALGWVEQYIADRKLDPKMSAFEAYENKRPYVGAKDGRVRLYFDDLYRSINKQGMKPIDMAKDFNPAMHLLGAERDRADLRKKGIRGNSARVWVLPVGMGLSGDE